MNLFKRAHTLFALFFLLAACKAAAPADGQKTLVISDLALAEPGPYFAGNREYTFVDETRGEREIKVTIYYPARKEMNSNGQVISLDAQPDTSGAPYPLILTETSSSSFLFQTHLVTHGYVMARIQIPDHKEYEFLDFQVVDWPRDFLFVLDQVADAPPEGLENIIDTARTGVTGYSYGGDISLALSGARIDPDYYLSYCSQPPSIESLNGGAEWYYDYNCSLADKWDEFSQFVGSKTTKGDDGLWQPVTDERILAVAPLAPSGAWLYGEKGLRAANRPVLIVAATEDEYSPYDIETRFIFENLGASPKSMITFVGQSHMMIEDTNPKAVMKHFVTAFFGTYLQGKEDYKKYITEEFVSQFQELYWGVYPRE